MLLLLGLGQKYEALTATSQDDERIGQFPIQRIFNERAIYHHAPVPDISIKNNGKKVGRDGRIRDRYKRFLQRSQIDTAYS